MKKNVLPLVIIILPIVLVVLFLWFLYGNQNQEPGDYLTAALTAKKTVSLKVNLGQDNIDTKDVLEKSEINISDPEGKQQKDIFDIDLVSAGNGEYELKINPKKNTLRPGKYYVTARFVTDNGVKDYSQNFYWGVLALNFDKSVYKPGETAYMQMGVLDDLGNTLCDADLTLYIKDPSGKTKTLATKNGTIAKNSECGPNNIIDEPDYYGFYDFNQEGVYEVRLTAITKDGLRNLEDFIEVKRDIPFEVKREGPTRIYPVASYEMKIKVKANQDFKGEVTEKVPDSFKVWLQNSESNVTDVVISPGSSEAPRVIKRSGELTGPEIVWRVDWKAGKEYELNYVFDAPDISPEFYLLDSLIIGDWHEARNWQIASDATDKTFSFASDAESWTANPSANTDTMAWDGTTGCPSAGSLKTESTKAGGGSETNSNYWEWTGTWENLGVTAGNTVTDVRGGYQYKLTNYGASSVDTGPLELRYGASCGTLDGTLLAATSLSAVQSTCQTRSQGSDVAVSSGIQASSSTICFRLNNTTDLAGGSRTATWYEDTIYLTITDAVANNAPTIDKVEDGPDPAETGNAVTFAVDWNDDDAEGVKMYICKADDGTSSGCGAGGTWCEDSDTFDTTDPLTCNYTTTSAEEGTNNYYAFVCDDSGDCNASGTAGTFTVNSATPMAMQFLGNMQFLFSGNIGALCDMADPIFGSGDLFNGSITGFPGGSQANGGGDDYNDGGSAPADRYEGTWTDCSTGDNCGTGLSSADMKDNNTDLIWSLPCNGSGCSSFSDSSPATYTWDNSGGNNNSQTASELCTSGSHGESGWSLPHQKQLMQAYIDGSYDNLEAAGVSRYYWSATTYSANTSFAWRTYLSHGYTFINAKTNSYYIRCVRLAP